MKKIILVGAALLLVTGAFAQNKFQWGVKAGFNYSTYKISIENASPSVNLGWKPGFYAGVVNNFNFNKEWSLQTELMYSLDGTRLALGKDLLNTISGGGLNKNLAASVCMHNLRLPIMVKFQPKGRLSIMAGPYVSYLVSTKLNFNNNLENLLKESEISTSDIKKTGKKLIEDNVNRFDLGATVGMEYRLCNGIFFDFRYNISLLNSLNDKVKIDGETSTWEEAIGVQPKLKYSALQIGVGYRF